MTAKEFERVLPEILGAYNEHLRSEGIIMPIADDVSLHENMMNFIKYYFSVSPGTVLFETFYELYPRKVSKKKAQSAFVRLPKYKQSLAIDNIPKYKLWADINGYSYTHPSTYINQERFMDEEIADLPNQVEMKRILDAARIGLSLKESSVQMTKELLMDVAKCIFFHGATEQDVKVIGKWMSEVWGTEDKYRAFITLQTLFNSSKFVERRAKARIYVDK